uniref:Uncharacterized protein n=1 Tax=Ralstonia solanacearum TaxID=305 RepID=A0A0S4UY06_RALSL|nr:protein of unknown function [Ralstonia solanacearum]
MWKAASQLNMRTRSLLGDDVF